MDGGVSTQVKICGLCRQADVEAVAALKPDAMGFVFWPRSPRAAVPADVGAWTQGFSPAIRKVGVFVDTPLDGIRRAVDEAGLGVVQLHGMGEPDWCDDLDAQVWKVVHLDRAPLAPWRGWPVDAFLVDSYSSTSPGGTGTVADWSAAARFVSASPRPVVLAGGLTPENVADAIRTVAPWGVDVSSGVESAPGRKCIRRVGAFIEQCRTR